MTTAAHRTWSPVIIFRFLVLTRPPQKCHDLGRRIVTPDASSTYNYLHLHISSVTPV